MNKLKESTSVEELIVIAKVISITLAALGAF